MPTDDTLTLRQVLRDATSDQHDRLDARVTAMDLTDPEDYRRFLLMQLMARAPVEAWLASCLPDAPPPLAALLARDLEALGATLPAALPFAPPADADPLGACWAIAGSSLGNRAMLHHLTKSGQAEALPTAFLADGAMATYWQGLKPKLEAPASAHSGALAAAEAVFAAFIAAADACLPPPSRRAA